MKITGKVAFDALPVPTEKNFHFRVNAERTINITIDRSITGCQETLQEGKEYVFNCYEEDGVRYVSTFMETDRSSGCGGVIDVSRIMNNMDTHLFGIEADEKKRGVKIYLELTGEINCLIVNDDTAEFNLNCDGKTYRCFIDTKMRVEERVKEFLDSAKHSSDAIFLDDRYIVGAPAGGMDCTVKGTLINDTFYVKSCVLNESNEITSENCTGEFRRSILKSISTLPENMKREIIDIVNKGKVYPESEKIEAPAFANTIHMRKKYEICKRFYPVAIQKAIEKTFEDKSLKDNQKTAVLDALINTKWGVKPELNTDIEYIKKGMDETHFGMEHLKNELIKIVVANAKKESGKGVNLLLVGAPGVGKTSLVKRFSSLYNIPFSKWC